MKKILVTLAAILMMATPAEAKGLTARKILGAPFFVVGFVVALVADVTVVPLVQGSTHYCNEPAIKGW